MARGREQTLDIEGRAVKTTNLDKPMYPVAGFTKGQVLDYYIRVAPYLLPHLKDRPVTLKRYPDGVGGEFFYEKDAPRFTPEWVRTFPCRVERADSRSAISSSTISPLWSGAPISRISRFILFCIAFPKSTA